MALYKADDYIEQFEVRFAPALAKKPTKQDGEKEEEKPTDPFAPPYQQDLFVAEDTVKEEGDDQGETFAVLVSSTLRTVLLFFANFVCVSSNS